MSNPIVVGASYQINPNNRAETVGVLGNLWDSFAPVFDIVVKFSDGSTSGGSGTLASVVDPAGSGDRRYGILTAAHLVSKADKTVTSIELLGGKLVGGHLGVQNPANSPSALVELPALGVYSKPTVTLDPNWDVKNPATIVGSDLAVITFEGGDPRLFMRGSNSYEIKAVSDANIPSTLNTVGYPSNADHVGLVGFVNIAGVMKQPSTFSVPTSEVPNFNIGASGAPLYFVGGGANSIVGTVSGSGNSMFDRYTRITSEDLVWIYQAMTNEKKLDSKYFSNSGWSDQDDRITGTSSSEHLIGRGGADTFVGSAGNDFIFGFTPTRSGASPQSSNEYIAKYGDRDQATWVSQTDVGKIDSVIYSGSYKDYAVTDLNKYIADNRGFSVQSEDKQDVLFGIERVKFSDMTMQLESSGSIKHVRFGGTNDISDEAYRIYKAAFNRTPDPGGLGYWIAEMDKGMDLVQVAARFIDSPEFRAIYGQNPTNVEFLTKVYSNVLNRTPDSAGLEWWVNEMKTNPTKTWKKVLADFSESPENQVNVASLIANGIVYDPWVG